MPQISCQDRDEQTGPPTLLLGYIYLSAKVRVPLLRFRGGGGDAGKTYTEKVGEEKGGRM